MKKEILERLERVLSATVSTLACMGMFVTVLFLLNVFWDGEVTNKNMVVIAALCIVATYILQQILLIVRYNRLEILADELESEESETVQEIIERWEKEHGKDTVTKTKGSVI